MATGCQNCEKASASSSDSVATFTALGTLQSDATDPYKLNYDPGYIRTSRYTHVVFGHRSTCVQAKMFWRHIVYTIEQAPPLYANISQMFLILGCMFGIHSQKTVTSRLRLSAARIPCMCIPSHTYTALHSKSNCAKTKHVFSISKPQSWRNCHRLQRTV